MINSYKIIFNDKGYIVNAERFEIKREKGGFTYYAFYQGDELVSTFNFNIVTAVIKE